MPDLELQLRALAADVEWPATPDLEGAVMARLAAGPAAAARGAGPRPVGRGPRARRLSGRRLAGALAAAVVLIPAAGAVAFPGARDDVLRWLGLRNVEVRRVPAPPPEARPELENDLGALVTLAQAQRRAGFRAAVPAALGPPDRVRVQGDRISLVYAPRPGLPALPGLNAGLLLTETRGGIDHELLRKLVYTDTRVRPVTVRGGRGVFIPVGHVYLYVDPNGDLREDSPLLTGPTLIWERAGLVHRLESRAGRRAALRIARSVDR